jgi:hypothetical protein
MKTLDKTAYVYIWFSPDWVPFYVGIGKTPSRWNPARIKAKDRNTLCFRLVQKYGPDRVRVQRFLKMDWASACAMERSLIAHFKRIKDGGTLANFTDGGEGVLSPRPEVLEAKRQRLMQRNNPMREYHKVLNTDPEIKARRAEGIRAAQPKRREKMQDPTALAQRKQRLKDTLNSEAFKAKRAEWDTPEYRAKLSAARRKYWADKRVGCIAQTDPMGHTANTAL